MAPRTIAFRDQGREARFHDIGFRELQADPMGAVQRLYTSLGEQLSPEAERRTTAWRAENSREKHGTHHYRAEDFGLDLDDLRASFALYTDRYDVPAGR